MTMKIDRRLLIKAGTFGLAALSIPGAAQALFAGRGFTHGVASGEPSGDSVLLWTRYVGDSDTRLTAEISPTPDFAKPIGGGSVTVSGARDHIAKLTVSGLKPDSWYFYRFVAADGSTSPTGRTRTLPVGETKGFNIGVFSCSNLPFGWFNGYAHAAGRNDIDLAVHTGDYLYEYGLDVYPTRSQALPGRSVQPDHEMVTLADYRLRYSSYRLDADLQRLHQVVPMIAMWDDHEIANDAWREGAQNHQSETEGDYMARRRIAEQVYREWMPVADLAPADTLWRSYQIGNLATLIRTESRLSGRDKPAELAEAFAGGGDMAASLAKFRDEKWVDPARRMLGDDQARWLGDEFKASKASGTRWQVWAQQCVMGSLKLPQETADWVPKDAPQIVRTRSAAGLAASKAGLPFNMDAWDGYPVQREALLKSAQAADADLVVLSGDSHNGWGFDLDAGGKPAGVEFAGHSISSPGFEAYAPTIAPQDVAGALVRANPQLKWADTSSRGYMTLQLTQDSATAHWHKLRTIRERSTDLAGSTSLSVEPGKRTIAMPA
ncbi:alkaline phosphatase D family protein [Blastomonas aquatica]|uniref:Alkaline phosphatase n=1 Tax=Blastomonas aquatica TaxID=1510276 RepID=A0ABQ1J4H0_9SPHN|nr:alkaline phosphatase D family protein [Blastomonas aquatica]GGB57612.1 alkaline phosphatase [Blastomonas aquatica]